MTFKISNKQTNLNDYELFTSSMHCKIVDETDGIDLFPFLKCLIFFPQANWYHCQWGAPWRGRYRYPLWCDWRDRYKLANHREREEGPASHRPCSDSARLPGYHPSRTEQSRSWGGHPHSARSRWRYLQNSHVSSWQVRREMGKKPA